MLRIGILGLGKVGTTLAHYLQQQGMDLVVYGRNLDKIRTVADTMAIDAAATLEAFIEASDLMLVTTSDDAIEQVGQAIADCGICLMDKVILHCSGALSGTALQACADQGAVIGSLHPLKAFSGSRADVTEMSKTFLTIESTDPQNKIIHELLSAMGNPHQFIDPEAKVLYHSAAVVMSNYMVTLMEEGLRYLRAIGFDDDKAMAMMLPLMEGTLSNIAQKGTVKGLTGPIQRGDEGTIKAHLKAVDTTLDPMAGDLYRLMGSRTIEMIQGKRLSEEKAIALTSILNRKGVI